MSDAESDGGDRNEEEAEENLEKKEELKGQEDLEGEDIAHMEEEQHPSILMPPLPHTQPLVAAYIVIVLFVIMGITTMVLLHFIPEAEMQSFIIHQTDTIIVPLKPSSKWLKSVSFHTSGSCLGDLYKIPCDELQPEHNSSYRSIKQPDNPTDYIYCIDGSNFTWTLTTETFIGEVEIWLFESYDEALEYEKHGTTLNCAQSPTMCVVMNNSTKRVVTLKPAKYDPLHGQFYFVRKSTGVGPGMKLVIDRYYYDTSVKYEDYKLTTVDSTPFISDLQGNFDASHVLSSSNDCFLFNTTVCESSKHNGTLTVTPVRSDYVLFWPGLFSVLSLFLLLLLVIFHIAYFRRFRAAQRASIDELLRN